MTKIKKAIVTGLGCGYLPIAPGTWGSAATTLVFMIVVWASNGSKLWSSAAMLILAVVSSAGCVALGAFTEQTYGKKDPSQCTIDEWAGQAITYLLLPISGHWHSWLWAAGLGFVLFRIMDIIKPPPARAMEKLAMGWGVLLDDVFAGIYANLACQILLRFWLLNVN